MRDQLKRLEELQTHDAKIQELTAALESIPKKIQATENDLARVEALLAAERTQLEETRRYLEDQRSLLDQETSQVQQAKHKLAQAKNPREMNAAQREIEQTRELAQSREGEIRKLVEAIEAKEKVLIERAAEVGKLREGIAADRASSQGKIDELKARLDALTAEREQLAEGVSKQILGRYAVIRKRKGTAVAAVRAGTCTGCNMNIPPQLYNNLRRGNTVENCPYCQRIIYADDGDARSSSGAPAGDKPETGVAQSAKADLAATRQD